MIRKLSNNSRQLARSMRSLGLFVVLVLTGLGCISCGTTRTAGVPYNISDYEPYADSLGWGASFKRGREIIHDLSALSLKKLAELKMMSAYHGERVAFLGVFPGALNDLVTENGFYLRVVNVEGKDLRPRSMGWVVMVCGRIVRIYPKNKIIVIEVKEDDWQILQTG